MDTNREVADGVLDGVMQAEPSVAIATTTVRCGETTARGGTCRRDAGWGTHHRGEGPCIEHDGGYLEPSEDFDASYADVVTDEKFRQLILKAEKSGNLMSLNSELALLKAAAAYMAEHFGTSIEIDPETGGIRMQQGAVGLNEQARDLLKIVREITNTQKVMAGVEAMAREYVPREQVRRYVGAMGAILQSRLRNLCPECGHELGMLDDVLSDIEELQKSGVISDG